MDAIRFVSSDSLKSFETSSSVNVSFFLQICDSHFGFSAVSATSFLFFFFVEPVLIVSLRGIDSWLS